MNLQIPLFSSKVNCNDNADMHVATDFTEYF